MSDDHTTSSTSNTVARLVKAHWATILLVALMAIFIAENTKRTSVDFLWLSFDTSLWFAAHDGDRLRHRGPRRLEAGATQHVAGGAH